MRIERIEVPAPFPPGKTNCYYIPDSNPALIDTGVNTPEALASLEAGLRKLGAGIGNIRRIILTHGHSDHAGSLGVVSALSGAPAFVHYRDLQWVLAGSEEASGQNEVFFLGFFAEAGVPGKMAHATAAAISSRFRHHFSTVSDIDLLRGGEVFWFDSFDLQVLHTPGHTAGSICLFDSAQGVLLSGDCLIEGFIPYISADFKNPEAHASYRGLELYEKSLDLLGELPVQTVLPGHGKVFSNPLQRIEQIRQDRVERLQKIAALFEAERRHGHVRGRGMSQFEVLEGLFPGASKEETLFTGICEVRGCLEMMEDQGLVSTVIDHGKRLYRWEE